MRNHNEKPGRASKCNARQLGKRGDHMRNRNENKVGCPKARQGELARGAPTRGIIMKTR
jgi:hypothetical protein